MAGNHRDRVFVSYSHKDRKLYEEFRTMLAPAIRARRLKVWDDTKIDPGAEWKEEIRKALASAKVAVLLVSTNFLASDFIDKHELPPLLEAAENEGLKVFWICLDPCLYQETEIAKYQAAYDPKKPLNRLKRPERQDVLTKICARLIEVANSTILHPSPTVAHAVETPDVTEAVNIGFFFGAQSGTLPDRYQPGVPVNLVFLNAPSATSRFGSSSIGTFTPADARWQGARDWMGLPPPASKCELINYGTVPVINVRVPMKVTYREVEIPSDDIHITGRGDIENELTLTIPKIEPGAGNGVGFYITNLESKNWVSVHLPDFVSFELIGDATRRRGRLSTDETSRQWGLILTPLVKNHPDPSMRR